MSPLVRRVLSAAFIVSVSISGCKCGSKVVGQGCQSDTDCQAQFNGSTRAFCDNSQTPPTCELHPQLCDTAADCCPAQVCNVDRHYCFDKYTPCTQDSECPAAGQVCETIGVFSKGQGCTFNKCDTSNNNACAAGTDCFNHYCVGTPPCNGGCTSTTNPVCVTATNLCTPPPPKAATCAQTCPKGQILVLQDPDNIFDTCVQDTEKCECDSLPPLQVHDVSRYSSMASNGQNLYVSAYDGEYQDLVLHTFDKNDLSKPVKTEWLDGVPTPCSQIGGDVNGPRGGCTSMGDDVGQYTSIAASPTGDLYIAYYDVTNGDLKFTARYGGPSAQWTSPMTVDGSTPVGSAPSNGDVGMYASIALDSHGIPAIAYFRRGDFNSASGSEDGSSTALVYAYAKRTQPLSKDDWTVVGDVDQLDRPLPACGGPCDSTQACVQDGAVQQCENKSTACTNTCSSGQACVIDQNTGGAAPACRNTLNDESLPELPLGVGLMPQLQFIDDHPVIAYHATIGVDPADGVTVKPMPQLKAVMGTGSGATPAFQAPVTIDGGLDCDTAQVRLVPSKRDTGRWPALAIQPAVVGGSPLIAIAFQDRTSQQLLIYQSSTLDAHACHADNPKSPGPVYIVDDGRPDPDPKLWHPQSFPGSQTSIGFVAGKIALAYQDSQPVDLILSVWDPVAKARNSRTTLRSQGSAGFWPHMAIVSGMAYVESSTVKAVSVKQAQNPLYVDAHSVP